MTRHAEASGEAGIEPPTLRLLEDPLYFPSHSHLFVVNSII